MAPNLKLKLRLAASSSSDLPRNSFTQTDYYRPTREEYYSPLPRVESPTTPSSPYGHYSTKRLANIEEDSDHDPNGRNKGGFWHVFDALFRRWRRQKARPRKHKHRHHSTDF